MASQRMRRVAVVGVHGVADQLPGTTANAMAELLRRGDPRWSPFEERRLRISVEELAVRHETGSVPSLLDSFDQRAPSVRRRHRAPAGAEGQDPEEGLVEAAHAQMVDQLSECRLPATETAFETVRLDACSGDGEPREVHAYELYWADLSRAAPGVWRGFAELYQLLFLLCGLGRKALDFARLTASGDRRWELLSFCHAAAEQLLALVIPFVNLCLVGASLPLLTTYFEETTLAWLCGAAAAALAFVLLSAVFVLRPTERSARTWAWHLVACCVAAGGAFASGPLLSGGPTYAVAWLALSGVAAVVVLAVTRGVSHLWPGALTIGRIGVPAYLAVTSWAWFAGLERGLQGSRLFAVDPTLRTIEVLLWPLYLSWAAAILFALASGFLSILVAKGAKAAERDRVKRALWTGQVALFVPLAVVMTFNMALWQTFSRFALAMLPAETLSVEAHEPFPIPPTSLPAGPLSLSVTTEALMLRSGLYLPVMVPALVIAGLIAAWSLFPAVLSDVRPSLLARVGAWESHWLGVNLTHAYRAWRFAGEILRLSVLVGPGFVIALRWTRPQLHFDALVPLILAGLGACVLALLASRGPLRFLALGFRAALDVMLDVLNWLRLHPRESNPRARICARYVGLLRSICAWRSADGRGYDQIVIVAHSQGAVITTDLMRFLTRENALGHVTPGLERILSLTHAEPIPISFFTMGSPLRALYNLRFPHQYGWVSGSARGGPAPDPMEAGFVSWSNAYRSGDYIGRHLWRSDADPDLWTPGVAYVQPLRHEICLGAGGHTHYWDQTAPEVAAELRRLVG